MAEYHLTNKAIEDLNEIWIYTEEKWSEEQADKYYGMLIDLCQEIADVPNNGKNYSEVMPELLGMKAGRHVIFYRRIKTDLIEIIRILHEQMDLERRIIE